MLSIEHFESVKCWASLTELQKVSRNPVRPSRQPGARRRCGAARPDVRDVFHRHCHVFKGERKQANDVPVSDCPHGPFRPTNWRHRSGALQDGGKVRVRLVDLHGLCTGQTQELRR